MAGAKEDPNAGAADVLSADPPNWKETGAPVDDGFSPNLIPVMELVVVGFANVPNDGVALSCPTLPKPNNVGPAVVAGVSGKVVGLLTPPKLKGVADVAGTWVEDAGLISNCGSAIALGCVTATWLDCPKLKLGGFVAIEFMANGFETCGFEASGFEPSGLVASGFVASGFVIVDVATLVSEPKLKVLFSTLELP